jgi:hypothetical protein
MTKKTEKPNKFGQRQLCGQAMAEFALVLPILLMVIYGFLEVGRLLFTYASVTNASREAARYASAYGLNTNDVPRYQDCAGIRESAKRTGFLLGLQDTDITIEYDHGPETTVFDVCDGEEDTSVELGCGDRVIVTVVEDFTPIVPLVPLKPMHIDSASGRTFTGIIELTEDYSCE